MGIVSNDSNENKKFKKNTFHQGQGRGERKRVCVRERKVASACVVCRDVEMPLPDITK